jgi:hypothetical protein
MKKFDTRLHGMTRLAHTEPVVIIACCFIALVPLLLLPIIPANVAAIMHLAAAAPLTSYQLIVFAWRRRTMVLDVLMSIVCIAFGGAAAILFLVSQQAAAHVCIGNALCTAAVHMMMMNTGGVRSVTICAAVLWLLGGVGMIIPSPFVSQRMFQCAAFPLMMLVFELTKMRTASSTAASSFSAAASSFSAAASSFSSTRPPAPFLSLRGPIPDFFINSSHAKKVAANKKDCDLVAAADALV